MIDKRSLLVGLGALVAMPFVGNTSAPVQREVKGGKLSLATIDAAIAMVPDAKYLVMCADTFYILDRKYIKKSPFIEVSNEYGEYIYTYRNKLRIFVTTTDKNNRPTLPTSGYLEVYVVSSAVGSPLEIKLNEARTRLRNAILQQMKHVKEGAIGFTLNKDDMEQWWDAEAHIVRKLALSAEIKVINA